MGFIKGGLQGSYEKLAADFVRALEKTVADEQEQKRKASNTEEAKADGEKKVEEEKKVGEGATGVEVETVS